MSTEPTTQPEAEDTLPATDDTMTGGDDKDILDAADEIEDGDDRDLLSDDEDAGDQGGDGPPDDYTFEPPKGTELSEEQTSAINAFKVNAKELGLSQEQFQKLVEGDVKRSQEADAAALDAYHSRIREWRSEARKDPEIVKHGFDNAIRSASGVLKQFGDGELTQLLRQPGEDNPGGFGLGNHPAVLRFLTRVSEALADPSLITSEDATQGQPVQRKQALDRMYPTMKKTA